MDRLFYDAMYVQQESAFQYMQSLSTTVYAIPYTYVCISISQDPITNASNWQWWWRWVCSDSEWTTHQDTQNFKSGGCSPLWAHNPITSSTYHSDTDHIYFDGHSVAFKHEYGSIHSLQEIIIIIQYFMTPWQHNSDAMHFCDWFRPTSSTTMAMTPMWRSTLMGSNL